MRSVLWVLAGLLLSSSSAALFARDELLELAHGIAERNDGAELADKLVSPEAVLDYIASHPGQVALASWELGQDTAGIYLNADRAQPLAAASLLLLAAFAEQQGSGEQVVDERVLLESWQRYVLPGGEDAHRAALHEARARGVLPAEPDAGERHLATGLPLSSVVRALVRHADPAAGDLLFERLGRARISEVARRAGFAPDAVPLPQAGLPLSWLVRPPTGGALQSRPASSDWLRGEPAAELLARYHALGPHGYADAAWQQLARMRDDSAFAEALRAQGPSLSLRARAQLAAALPPRATARASAALMGQLASAPSAGHRSLRAQLEWPMESERARVEFEQLGRLAGSQPGVATSLTYARVRNGGTKVLAVFFRDLPLAVWLRLSSGFLLQRFEQQLLSDEELYGRARAQLSRAASPSAANAIAVTLEHGTDR